MKFSIFDCETGKRISDESYATAEQANHDYHMNAGHTCVKPIEEVMNCPHCDEPHRGPGASAHSLSNGASLCILSTWLP
jgi:hypothetical protein